MSIMVSAPGKLMLMGEHAVLYGYPCLVCAIDKYLTVTVNRGKKRDEFILTGVKDNRFVKQAVETFRTNYNLTNEVRIKTASELGNFGLGSSSACVVATIKALCRFYKVDLKQKGLFDLSKKVILSVQKSGSGYDAAAAVYGGILYFSKGGRIIEPVKADVPSLVIGFSTVKADTLSMINLVARKRQEYKKGVDNILKNIGKLVDQAKRALLSGDFTRLGTLMNYNQDYLEDLGVSTDQLNRMIKAARDAGAYGAKLSGAGGGDCMIALASEEKKREVENAIKAAGGEILNLKIY